MVAQGGRVPARDSRGLDTHTIHDNRGLDIHTIRLWLEKIWKTSRRWDIRNTQFAVLLLAWGLLFAPTVAALSESGPAPFAPASSTLAVARALTELSANEAPAFFIRPAENPATRILADGRLIGVVDSPEAARTVLEWLRGHWAGEAAQDVEFTETIVLERAEADPAQVQKPEALFAALLEAGTLHLRYTVERVVRESVPCEEQVVYDNTQYKGYSLLQSAGEDGLAMRRVAVECENGRELEQKTLAYAVLRAPENRVTVQGTLDKPDWWPCGKLIQPVQGKVSSEFGRRGSREFHTGIDIANSTGTSVAAADGGTVIFAGWLGNYGRRIVVEHDGMQTAYSHLSRILVKVGDHVYQGDEIGRVGSTGRSTGPHLHFEVLVDGSAVNPRDYVDIVSQD